MSKPEWFDRFKKDAGGGEGPYLKASDCSDKPRMLRPIPWMHNGEKVNCLCYLEGWEYTDEKNEDGTYKSKPVRFAPDAEQEEFEGHEWAMGKAFPGQKPQPQYPKPAVAFIGLDKLTQTVKVCAFTQSSINCTLLEYTDEDSALFIPDWSTVNIIIAKPNPKEQKYKVETRQLKDTEFEPWQIKALEEFTFSWDAFMNGDDPFEDGDRYEFEDDNGKTKKSSKEKQSPKKETKEEVKETKEKYEFEKIPEWKDVKTPLGKKLSEFDFDKLVEMRDYMIEKKVAKGKVFNAVCTGIQELSDLSGEDIPF